MSCRVIVGRRDGDGRMAVVFYDSVTDFAFGPIMRSAEQADSFRRWLEHHGKQDPRGLSDDVLASLFRQFEATTRDDYD